MPTAFRTFTARGNVLDLAVGIIIGAAFTAIVNAIVVDLINPIVGLIIGGIDVSNLYTVLSGEVRPGASVQAARDPGAAIVASGSFVMAVPNVLIIAWVLFLIVRAVNRARDAVARTEDPAPAASKGPTQEALLAGIRDLLKARAQRRGAAAGGGGGRGRPAPASPGVSGPGSIRGTMQPRGDQRLSASAGESTSMPSALPTA